MTGWVLVLVFTTSHGSIATGVDFNSRGACINARNVITKKVKPRKYEVVQCFKKD